MSRLPGWEDEGGDADGYLAAGQVADLVGRYARESAAPVRTGTTTISVRPREDGFVVDTDRGPWKARTVVMAAGATRASIPVLARHLPGGTTSLSALDYRQPDQLPRGGCSWSEPRPAAPRSPTSSSGPDARSPSPSANTCGSPATTTAATSSGGWTR